MGIRIIKPQISLDQHTIDSMLADLAATAKEMAAEQQAKIAELESMAYPPES